MWFHDQGVLLQVNTGITLQMTSWHNTDIHTNTVRTNFNHFSTLLQNLVLLWLILFEKYFFKHSNPVSSVVSEIKSGVRGSYAAEKVGTLKVKLYIVDCIILNCHTADFVIFSCHSRLCHLELSHCWLCHLELCHAVDCHLYLSCVTWSCHTVDCHL